MKRPFSLLEVVISLALTTILMTGLFSSYRHLSQNHLKIEQIKESLHSQFVCQLRLNQIFDKLKEDEPIATREDKLSLDKALCFNINNTIDPDPNYCGLMECKLFCSKDKSFVLDMNGRQEIFFRNVNKYSIRFFDSHTNEWSPSWEKGIPALVQIHINEEPFTFFITRANQEVTFE